MRTRDREDRGNTFWNYSRYDDDVRRDRGYIRSRDPVRHDDDYPSRLVPAGGPTQILYPPLRNANNTPDAFSSPYYGGGGYGGFVGPYGRGGNRVTGPYGGKFPRPVISTNPYGFYRNSALNQPQVLGMAPYGRFAWFFINQFID